MTSSTQPTPDHRQSVFSTQRSLASLAIRRGRSGRLLFELFATNQGIYFGVSRLPTALH